MKYIECSVVVENSKRESLVDFIISNGIESYEEVSKDIVTLLDQDEQDWDFIDKAQIDNVINVGEDKTIIRFYYNEKDYPKKENLLKEISKFGELSTQIVDDQDWENAWKEYFKTTKVGDNIVIKPTWEDYERLEDDKVIEIDPGMAFGSGTHETTSMCLELLERYIKDGDTLFDIGCGSGILSIAGALLGAEEVVGVDIDTLAVKVAKDNVNKNNLSDIVKILEGDLFQVVEGRASIIISNIIAEVIVEMIEDVKDKLNPEGIFICSGIILDKESMVIEKLEEFNYTILDIKRIGEWVAIVAQR